MFIYNVTIKVNHSIHQQWVQWMLQKHIPQVMATGYFTKYQFTKLLEVDETDGPTYTTQYYAQTMEDYTNYIQLQAPALRQDANNTWGNKFIGFRTLMQVVN